MEPTMLYNGVHLQRKKRFTLSPRHSLNSTVQINWPQSFHHQDTSPTLKIEKKYKAELRLVREKHNSFVDSYLATNLNLTDSRAVKVSDSEDKHIRKTQRPRMSINQNERYQQQSNPETGFHLPKLYREQQNCKKNNIVSDLISKRNNSYFSRILRQKLKKYDFQDEA